MADPTIRTSLQGAARNAVTGSPAREAMIVQPHVAMLEFDLDGTLPTAQYLTMIPANDNPNGLIIMDMWTVCTELVASDATDAILTVRDGASSPNTIDTLTISDTDAIGDMTTWTLTDWESRVDGTDYSAYHVEAGVKVEAAITTAASDASAVTGRVLLCIRFLQIPSNRD